MKVLSEIEVFQCLKEYYNSFIEEGIIKIVKDDNEKLVWVEQESGYKIAISLGKFISPIEVRRPWKMHQVSRMFQDYNYELDNKKIDFYKDKGFRIKNSAEFLFHYILIESEYPEHPMVKFTIKNVEFEIGKPSDMFKVMFHHLSYDDDFNWENIYTIKLKNLDEDEKNEPKSLEQYLQYAMFIIHKCAPSDLVSDYPQVYQYMYTHDYFIEPEEILEDEMDLSFRLGEYTEPMAFFNEGKQKRNFLSFYKVIEYFYIISRQNDFEPSTKTNNKDKSKVKEIELLEKLIYKIKHIEPLLDLAFANDLIRDKDDKKEFAGELYKIRNSKVHGKGGTKYKLSFPEILSFDDDNAWEIIIENLAELVILQFCFSQPKQ
ncbi:hypothetical protein EXW53_26815 (plasmid) [Bacillus mycoides]|uniref:hypothetical protein n=1 Tax=Bacillus mycoides TaxID=1405 RepID=UPI001C0369B5|nr:hypothetical protein [Bacillus mycoides]QWH42888.1 hypothetical protein EXW53_26815 [Bacillus mycoides]